MALTNFIPARRRLTAAVAVGTMALTLAGLYAPGAGAASQQPPVCQSFTVADAQGSATGPAAGEIQTAPIPGAQAGTQTGGTVPQGATNQAEQPGGMDTTSNAPESVSCVVDAAVPNHVCVVNDSGAAGQAAGANAPFSTEAGTTAQDEAIAGSIQPGATQQTAPGQVPAGAQVQSGGAGPAGNQVLNPNEQATATAGTAGTQGAQGTQDASGAQGTSSAPGVPAGETGTGAGGANTVQQPNQQVAGAGGEDVLFSTAKPDGTVGACGAGVTVGADAPADVIEDGTASTNAVPATEQVSAGGCEETVISEYPLPGGGTVKVSVTPC